MFNRISVKHVNLANKLKNGVLWNSTEATQIKIPRRIERGPADILQALASTVSTDWTAPHYKYHDDPYLIPTNNMQKRIYALSKESGRKAARWIRQQHSELFLYTVMDPPTRKITPYKNADPPIEAFVPTPNYKSDSNVTVEDLEKAMDSRFVEDAKLVYGILESKRPECLTLEIQQRYLEMLCFFNDTEPTYEEWIEERWLQQGKMGNKERIGNTWKTGSRAEELFSQMEKTPQAYSAMIRGMAKYLETEKAYALFEECKQKKIPLSVDAYNSIFSIVGHLKQNAESRWELILMLLNDMKKEEIRPDVDTMNGILESLRMNYTSAKKYCSQIYAEFVKELGIEPSLTTWTHIISIYHNNKSPRSDVLYKIMDKLKGKELTIRDPKDTMFFVSAMAACRYHLKDIALAHQINDLLLVGFNYKLIGDSFRESIYYRHYFIMCCQQEPLETFMQMYHNYVPNVYVPELVVIEEMINSVDLNGGTEHYPLIWSHIVMFGYAFKHEIIELLLESMVRNLPPITSDQPESYPLRDNDYLEAKTLNSALAIGLEAHRLKVAGLPYVKPTVEKTFSQVARDIWTHMESDNTTVRSFRWTAGMLSDLVELFVRGNNFEEATKVVEKLNSGKGIISVPNSPQSLINYSKVAIKENNPKMAAVAMNYLATLGFPEVIEESKNILVNLLNTTPEEVSSIAKKVKSGLESHVNLDKHALKLVTIYNQEIKVSDESKVSSSSSSSDSSESSDDEGEVLDDRITEK